MTSSQESSRKRSNHHDLLTRASTPSLLPSLVFKVVLFFLIWSPADGSDGRLRPPSPPPPYAVPMEPMVHYSQRDPLYGGNLTSAKDLSVAATESQAERRHSPIYSAPGYHDHHYSYPEPIIEIIIKESNQTLPPPTTQPPRPPTKEPIHVFYVKYKTNPNPKGDHDKIIYEKPIAALVPHMSSETEGDASHVEKPSETYYPPPPTTTLRTIIRPDSETYHGSGIKITFGSPHEEQEVEEGTEQRPRVAIPDGHVRFPEQHIHRDGSLPIIPTSPPITQEQILTYQQQKQYLYEQSLKSQTGSRPQTSFPTASIPRQFQQPSKPKISELQINFNNQRLQQQLQQDHLPQHRHQPFIRHSHHQQQRFQQPSTSRQPDQLKQQQQFHQYHQFNSGQQQPQQQQPQLNYQVQNYKKQNFNDRPQNQQYFQPFHYSNTQLTTQSKVNYQQVPKYPSVANIQITTSKSIDQASNPLHEIKSDYNIVQPNGEFGNKPIKSNQYNNQISLSEQIPTRQPNVQQVTVKSNQIPLTKPTDSYVQQHTFNDGEIVKSISQSEEHQIEHSNESIKYLNQGSDSQGSSLNNNGHSNYQILGHNNYYTVNPKISTVPPRIPIESSTRSSVLPSTTTAQYHVGTQIKNTDEDIEEEIQTPLNKTAIKTNLAALPEEVPADLREQLLSSGILSNADISILDYDKVGDIPIENLPPEALEQFYGAGSDPVPSVLKIKGENKVEMKVVRYNPNTEEGKSLAKSYIKKDATTLDPIVLNDSKYNRYLPLKVNGTQFPIPDVPQLNGRIINSVVVLAPVDYEYVKEREEGEERIGRAIHVEGVRFVAGATLKDLVKSPTRENFTRWLHHEKNVQPRDQSVVLLIAQKPEGSDIFMYDVGTGHVNRLRGELSRTFVQVAESNSSSRDLEGLDSST